MLPFAVLSSSPSRAGPGLDSGRRADNAAPPLGRSAEAKRTDEERKATEAKQVRPQSRGAIEKRRPAKHARAKSRSKRSKDEIASKESRPALTGDLAAVKNAIDLARKAKTGEATASKKPSATRRPRNSSNGSFCDIRTPIARFGRYAAFIADNPGWPSMGLLRRRAEARLWQERSDATTVRSFTGDQPTSTKGRLALARSCLPKATVTAPDGWVREAWRSEELSERSEAEAFEMFRDLLTREDHRARMDKRIGAKDFSGAKRAAQRLGNDELSIVKACAA